MNRVLSLVAGAFLLWLSPVTAMAQTGCAPTVSDAEGPFYKANAPLRENTGLGLTISGKVRSAGSCTPIPGARVEWWQANREGQYDDEHRGALLTAGDGSYRLETDFPPAYYDRPPHVHVKVFAHGYRTLTTQIYPEEGQKFIAIDLIVARE
jgi:protocatechuate 3,4-dioxygenase beta subunit